jgi:hypothetical protein
MGPTPQSYTNTIASLRMNTFISLPNFSRSETLDKWINIIQPLSKLGIQDFVCIAKFSRLTRRNKSIKVMEIIQNCKDDDLICQSKFCLRQTPKQLVKIMQIRRQFQKATISRLGLNFADHNNRTSWWKSYTNVIGATHRFDISF